MKINEIYKQSYTDGPSQILLLKGNFDSMMWNKNYKFLKKIGDLDLVRDNDKQFLALFLVKNKEPIGQYNFGTSIKIQGKTSFKPGWIYTIPEYRKQGLALFVYTWILNKPNTVILSDSSHTLYSRLLWKGLFSKFNLYSIDYENMEKNNQLKKINTIDDLNAIYGTDLRLLASKGRLNENI